MVEQAYKWVTLPFEEVASPEFKMSARWTLPQLISYLYTWSAKKLYQQETGVDSIANVLDDITRIWGEFEKVLTVSWPLSLRVWRKNDQA